MTCQDCGMEIPEEFATSGTLQVEYRCIERTGRCIGCEHIHRVKGEQNDRGPSVDDSTDV